MKLTEALRDRCRSCKKPIIWAETSKGRRMPVDPEPVTSGNVELRDRGKLVPPLATIVRINIAGDEMRYNSHFVTCPQAGKWRKTS